MSYRPPVPDPVAVQVLVDNQHMCCICQRPNLHVQLHHIDEDKTNNSPANLAVVCGNCHSRVTGNEGFGRQFSHSEVAEFKRRWELACAAALTARAERVQTERLFEERNATENTVGLDYVMPLYSNADLARLIGFDTHGRLAIAELDGLKDRLRLAGKLRTERPTDRAAFEPGAVVGETILATKVIFPHWILKESVPGVRELAVWVADPTNDFRTRPDQGYDFTGTFLYLVTPIYQVEASDTFYSGCSALQVISNMTSGKPFLTTDHEEPLGRWNPAHPTDKLKSIGGIVLRRSRELTHRCSPKVTQPARS